MAVSGAAMAAKARPSSSIGPMTPSGREAFSRKGHPDIGHRRSRGPGDQQGSGPNMVGKAAEAPRQEADAEREGQEGKACLGRRQTAPVDQLEWQQEEHDRHGGIDHQRRQVEADEGVVRNESRRGHGIGAHPFPPCVGGQAEQAEPGRGDYRAGPAMDCCSGVLAARSSRSGSAPRPARPGLRPGWQRPSRRSGAPPAGPRARRPPAARRRQAQRAD